MEKQYDQIKYELQAQQLWKEQQTYSAANNPGPLYSVDTPPPTVSGNLHIGHIFSYTQTDIIARYKRMSGFSVFYPFGFDDNGLATERYVEKKRDIFSFKLSRSEFIKICLEESHLAEQKFQDLWQRIGLSADWSSTYSTISDPVRKISQSSFLRLLKKGFVYRRNEPALFCTTCRTSVAQAELDDKTEPGTFNDIVFQDEQGNDLIIGTTRPELLPSCVALLYNPDDARYQHLAGKKAIVPIFGFEVPIIADEKVDIEKGTGLVMCCTFGDKTDIEWYKKHNLQYKQSIGFDGKFVESIAILAGLKVPQAREAILQELKNRNLLIRQQPITHAVNIHERCKKEIEYMMLQQWFLNILDHKKKFIELAQQINWYPAYMKSRYINWVENISWDWCLSRQRFYGIPFPVWYCNDCNTMLLAQEKDLPIDPQETNFPGKQCTQCSSKNIRPDTDVMDTWNTSSLTPYICASLYDPSMPVFDEIIKENFLPMSMRPQAHDIIRTWAFYTIVKSWMHHDTVPWKDIVISGHVLASAKEKISKSQANNPLEPENLLKTYSADAIRYWTASGSLGTDISFSDTQLKIGQRLITKLWNAFKFVHEHLQNYVPEKEQPKDNGVVNEWLLHQISGCFDAYKNYFAQHEFSLSLDAIEKFFWHDFCDNYLELIKDQLFNPAKYPESQVTGTKWTLYHVGMRILQLYAPYLPHVTETLYGLLYKHHEKTSSIHQTKFEIYQKQFVFQASASITHAINELVQQVRKLKTEKQISLKTELTQLTVCSNNAQLLQAFEKEKIMLQGVTQARIINFEKKEGESSMEQMEDQWQATVSL